MVGRLLKRLGMVGPSWASFHPYPHLEMSDLNAVSCSDPKFFSSIVDERDPQKCHQLFFSNFKNFSNKNIFMLFFQKKKIQAHLSDMEKIKAKNFSGKKNNFYFQKFFRVFFSLNFSKSFKSRLFLLILFTENCQGNFPIPA